jgi:hypothetical protein
VLIRHSNGAARSRRAATQYPGPAARQGGLLQSRFHFAYRYLGVFTGHWVVLIWPDIYIYTGLVTMDHSIYTECGSVSASAESVWPLDRLWGFGSCGLEFKSSGGLRVFAVFMCRGSPLVLYALLLLLPRKRRMSQTSSCPLMTNQHTHLYLPPSVLLISAEPCYFGAAAAGDIGCKTKKQAGS